MSRVNGVHFSSYYTSSRPKGISRFDSTRGKKIKVGLEKRAADTWALPLSSRDCVLKDTICTKASD